jgi:hypothetical protein
MRGKNMELTHDRGEKTYAWVVLSVVRNVETAVVVLSTVDAGWMLRVVTSRVVVLSWVDTTVAVSRGRVDVSVRLSVEVCPGAELITVRSGRVVVRSIVRSGNVVVLSSVRSGSVVVLSIVERSVDTLTSVEVCPGAELIMVRSGNVVVFSIVERSVEVLISVEVCPGAELTRMLVTSRVVVRSSVETSVLVTSLV